MNCFSQCHTLPGHVSILNSCGKYELNLVQGVSALRVMALSQSSILACVTLILGIMPVASSMVMNPALLACHPDDELITRRCSTRRRRSSLYPSLQPLRHVLPMTVSPRPWISGTQPSTRCHCFTHEMQVYVPWATPSKSPRILNTRHPVLYSSRICAVLSDLIVVVVILYRTTYGLNTKMGWLRSILHMYSKASSLGSLLLRDGEHVS